MFQTVICRIISIIYLKKHKTLFLKEIPFLNVEITQIFKSENTFSDNII